MQQICSLHLRAHDMFVTLSLVAMSVSIVRTKLLTLYAAVPFGVGWVCFFLSVGSWVCLRGPFQVLEGAQRMEIVLLTVDGTFP